MSEWYDEVKPPHETVYAHVIDREDGTYQVWDLPKEIVEDTSPTAIQHTAIDATCK